MKNILIIHILLLPIIGLSQQSNLFLEIGGSGGLGSFNFERTFAQKEKHNFNFRAGIAIATTDPDNGISFVFPLMMNMVIGESKNKLEMGIGQGLVISTTINGYIRGIANLGYRLEPENKNFYFRLMYTPLFSYINTFYIQHWAGFSIGYHLKSKK